MLSRTVDRFLVAMRQVGRSPQTVRTYGWHLERLVIWCASRDVDGVDQVSRDLLREWGAGLWEGWSASTVKSAVCTCRSFFRWCAAEGLMGGNPALGLKVPRVPGRVQRTITLEEMQQMLAVCDPVMAKGCRDIALLNVLIDTGLRSGEVCKLRVDRLDLAERMITAVIKGGQESWVWFGETTAVALESWVCVRPAALGVGSLFVAIGGSCPGQPLTRAGLRTIVRKLGLAAGIEGVTTHAFRRGFACIATRAGAPSRMVQEAGRWSDIKMVERYTKSLLQSELYSRGWSPADHVNCVEER